MIDISALKPSRLEELPMGALFIPVVEGGSHFLAGRLGAMVDALVALDGEQPFHVGETATWSRAPGLIVEGGRFQADPASGMSASSFHDLPVGALLITPSGPMLVGHSRNGSCAVQLAEPADVRPSDAPSVAFRRWQYVTGADDALTVHFAHKG